jgi:uncharacterized membrane protein YkvA (DUF1232 family)
MLQALQVHLRMLVESDSGNLRNEISERFGVKATDEQVQAIKEFIFLMPPALKILSQYWSDKATPGNVKKLAGSILTYIYHPDDLLSENEYGLFGYLDDAYLVVSTFQRIQDLFIRNWDQKSEMERDLMERTNKLLHAPRLIIPDTADSIDSTLDKLIAGEIDGLISNLKIEKSR